MLHHTHKKYNSETITSMDFPDFYWVFLPQTEEEERKCIGDIREMYSRKSPFFKSLFSLDSARNEFDVPEIMAAPDVFNLVKSFVWDPCPMLPDTDPETMAFLTHVSEYLQLEDMKDACLNYFRHLYLFLPKRRNPSILRIFCRLKVYGELDTATGLLILSLIRENADHIFSPRTKQFCRTLECVLEDYPDEDFIEFELPLRFRLIQHKQDISGFLDQTSTPLSDPSHATFMKWGLDVLQASPDILSRIIRVLQEEELDSPNHTLIPAWLSLPRFMEHMEVKSWISFQTRSKVHGFILTRNQGSFSGSLFSNMDFSISFQEKLTFNYYGYTQLSDIENSSVCITTTIVSPALIPVSVRTELSLQGRQDYSISQSFTRKSWLMFRPLVYPQWEEGEFYLIHVYLQVKENRSERPPRKRKKVSHPNEIISVPTNLINKNEITQES